jgi:hypothetical protein
MRKFNNAYAQLPLCALSFGSNVKQRLNAIIDYAVARAGSRLFSKLSPNERDKFRFVQVEAGNVPRGFDAKSEYHVAALYGAHCLGVTYPDFRSLFENYKSLSSYVSQFESRHGRDAWVRIRMDWLFAARDGRGINYREFTVLCAIFSVIGRKKWAIVTRLDIQRRALGYRNQDILMAELPNRIDGAQPLTLRQARDTIAQLHLNKFFARCTVARRITYYSIRESDELLRKSIFKRRTYAARFRARQSAKDKALTTAIKLSQTEGSGDTSRWN